MTNIIPNILEETQNQEKIIVDGLEYINLEEDRIKKQPWSKARALELKKTAEFITPDEMYKLAMGFENYRDRALFAILYLTAARIEEVVRYKRIKWGKKKALVKRTRKNAKLSYVQDYKKKKESEIEWSIKKQDMVEDVVSGRHCIVFRLRNLKNYNNKIKIIPIPLDNEINKKFLLLIETYVQIKEEWEELFPFQKRNGERIINLINWNPHYIRKVRLTHLVRYNKFNEEHLKVFAGWTDGRPAKHYIRLGWRDLMKNL